MDKLRSEAAARYVGLAPSTLAKMRVRGDGPPYSKAGARVIGLGLDPLKMAPLEAFGLAEEESELDGGLPA